MPEIQLIARYTITAGHEEQVLALITEVAQASRAEPGNLAYEIVRPVDDDRRLILLERYVSAEALDAHRETPHFQGIVLEQIVPLLESRTFEAFAAGD